MNDTLLQPDQTVEPQLDPNKNYLTELVGEGKKFSTPEELAKGKFYADQTIEVMKKRQDELYADYVKLREENVAKAKLEDLIKQATSQQLASSETTPANEVKDKPAIDPSQLKNLIAEEYKNQKFLDKATENFNKVQEKLTETLGVNYSNVLKQRSSELGLSDEDINALARKSPAAFFRTFGIDQPQGDTFQAPARSNQRSDSFAPRGAPKRTWAYYQELKKADPALYHDRKIGAQMAQDVVEQGDAFYDGNFYVKGLHER